MIENDFYIDNKVIKHVDGHTATYSVLEFHRFLSDLADRLINLSSNTPYDDIDITSPTPSMRKTDDIIELINGFRIDDETAKWLKDGAIIQGDEIYDSQLPEEDFYIKGK